jgi:dienelactone hydrolase
MGEAMEGALAGFERFVFSNGQWRRPVYRMGKGPAVIVIHEVPGLHPLVLDFARALASAGLTVYCPSLFGEPGRRATALYSIGVIVKTLCVRREFTVWAKGQSSPIVDWLRALARKAHADCGGKGVGAVGMCLTGGFALAMMTEPAMVAPVLSQPSLPFGKKAAAMIDCSADELACAKRRFESENLSLIGLRFKDDPIVPASRFATLKEIFGPKFEAIEIDSSAAKPRSRQPAHSVLTIHLDRSNPDGPTMKAHDHVIAFFKARTGAA